MSIFLWYGYEGGILDRAKRIKEAGFSSVSMWWEPEEARSPLENLRIIRSLGLSVDQVHLAYYPGGLWSGEEVTYAKAFTRSLEELSQGCVPLAVFHPASQEEIDRPVSEEGIYQFSKIYERARVLGIELAGENLKEDKHLLALLDSFDISLCLDTGHLGVSGNYPLLKNYFHRVRSLHIHDNNGVEDLHLIPGDGILDLESLLKELPADVDLHLEINKGLNNHYMNMSEEEFLNRAQRSLERLGGKLGR